MTSVRPSEPRTNPQHLGRVRLIYLQSAHPDRVRACLDRRLGDAVVRRLVETERVAPRLAGLMLRHHGFAPHVLEDFYRSAGLGSGALGNLHPLLYQDLVQCALLAGVVWHARSLKNCVSGKAVADLTARIGRRAHTFALRNADLAAGAEPISHVDHLVAAIETDGFLCIGARLAAEHPVLRNLILLQLPADTPAEASSFSSEHLERAPAIVERALAELGGAQHVS
jgi:YOP proteins translocation protein K (YscK)